MKEIDLRDAFPPMGGQMERTMNRAYARIREEKRMRHKRKITLLVAAVLTLALAGTALAAGYISRLRQNLDTMNAQGAAAAVHEVEATAEAGDFRAEVVETLVEGDHAWLTVKFTTPDDEPMLVSINALNDGVSQESPRMLFGEMFGHMLLVGGAYGDEVTLELDYYEGMPEGTTDVQFDVTFARPLAELADYSSQAREWGWEEWPEKMPTDKLVWTNEDLPHSVQTWQWMPLSDEELAHETSSMTKEEAYYFGLDSTLETMEKDGIATKEERFILTAQLSSGDEGEYVYKNVAQSEFQFDGYKVEVEKVNIGELHGEIVLRIIPDREMEIMNMDNDDPLWRSFTVYDDETGRELLYNGSGGTELDENGKVYYEKTIYPFDLGTISGRIRLVPEHTDLDCNTTVYEDEAIVLELLP